MTMEWLLEINTRPSAYEEVLDMAVNQPLVQEIFNIGKGSSYEQSSGSTVEA
jgi:hypothetical protein